MTDQHDAPAREDNADDLVLATSEQVVFDPWWGAPMVVAASDLLVLDAYGGRVSCGRRMTDLFYASDEALTSDNVHVANGVLLPREVH